MPLFREKATCPNCGTEVRQPKDAGDFLCPSCGKPGPWASDEQRTRWEQELQERQRIWSEQEKARLDLRRRALEQAASLTPVQVQGFVAQRTEDAYLAMPAKLAEWKKQRGHYEGGSGIRGFSMRVPGTKSMRVYSGGLNQRQYVPGEEGWQLTDDGTAVITSKRVVFMGQSKAIEWAFPKLVELGADHSNGSLLLQVSNRQKAHVLQLPDLELFEVTLDAAIEGRPGLPQQTGPELPPPPPSS
jgi:uncharacterized Zn finger protein (UPF0148 family)